MGDEQGGGAELLLERADLLAQLEPDLGVQGGQRLVEQQHPGLDGERPGQRDALLLAAGQLVGNCPACGDSPTSRAARRPLAPLAGGDLRIRSPKATLSSADMFGNRL